MTCWPDERLDPRAVTCRWSNCSTGFCNRKTCLANWGDIARRTFLDYKLNCDLLLAFWGMTRAVEDLRPDDFEALRKHAATKRGPYGIGNVVLRTRVLFKYACDQGLMDKPIRWAEANGFKPGSVPTFGRNLLAACPSIRTARPRVDGTPRQRVYTGIVLDNGELGCSSACRQVHNWTAKRVAAGFLMHCAVDRLPSAAKENAQRTGYQ